MTTQVLSPAKGSEPCTVGVAVLDHKRCARERISRLEKAAQAANSAGALFIVDCLRECAALKNIWAASNLQNAGGEYFTGYGTYASCRQVLCPFCADARRQGNLKRARAAIESTRPYAGESWQLLTLTAPLVAPARLLSVIGVFQRAWTLLRNRKWWRRNVRAGIKNIEWTAAESGVCHVHLHLLLCARHISKEQLQTDWTEAITKAWSEQRFNLEIKTRDGFSQVDVRRLHRHKIATAGRPALSIEETLHLVSRYLCKAKAWEALSDADLVEVAESRRLPRLFELLGEARETRRSILDTNQLSAGEHNHTPPKRPRRPRRRNAPLRELAGKTGRAQLREMLAAHFERRRACRKAYLIKTYPFATFIDGEELLDHVGEASAGELQRLRSHPPHRPAQPLRHANRGRAPTKTPLSEKAAGPSPNDNDVAM